MAKKKKAAPTRTRKHVVRKNARGLVKKTVSDASSNGLRAFAMHQSDTNTLSMIAEAQSASSLHPAAMAGGAKYRKKLDPETVAEGYLQSALQSPAVPAISAPKVDNTVSEFKSLGTETIPLTNTKVVKFRQTLNQIPVYGSLVSVELDDSNDLVGINSAIGDPKSVNPVASVAPSEALKAVRQSPGYKKKLDDIVPHLNFYFDQGDQKWRLVYILEDVPVETASATKRVENSIPFYMDFVVDAHDGKVVAELPRTPTVAIALTAKDELGNVRSFAAEKNGALTVLQNTKLNVQTFDFGFRDPETQAEKLPGSPIQNPPAFSPTAISAHANAEAVATFLQNELKRNNIDDHGGAMNSSVNCVVVKESLGPKQWANAFWDGAEMVYGQVRLDDDLISFCRDLDVVAHEMFHGVTDNTARLEYRSQSGALNESFSDVFGLIVANYSEHDQRNWSWQIGKGLDDDGKALRDMSDPTRFGQPENMADYKPLPPNKDNGGVHTNSGIPNKAAFNILTAADSHGDLVFQPRDVAIIYYLAVTQHLSRTSQFSDCRRAVVLSARTLFRNLSAAKLKEKIDAVEKAFIDVGIA